ncbi:alpha/beta hydrolase [Nocardia nova]|uniref:alpha/beta hydrolase n=1 Tax=Nocardia nova TaxID=37330 RepID=UPI0033EAA19A
MGSAETHSTTEPSNAVGVLLLHGLTDSPDALAPWADRLRDNGFVVSTPLLPGHGTSLADLRRTGWRDWLRGAAEAYADLAGKCRTVVVGGHSMGGALALELAAAHPEIAAVLLVNPSVAHPSPFIPVLGVLKYVVPSLPNSRLVSKPGAPVTYYPRMPLASIESMSRLWRHLETRLPEVKQPVLLFRSVADGKAGELCARRVLTGVSSDRAEEVPLPNSFHLAMLDYDAESIFDSSVAFLKSL